MPTGEDLYSQQLVNDEKFQMVQDAESADVIVSVYDFKKTSAFVKIDTEKHIYSQFPYESVLVMKH